MSHVRYSAKDAEVLGAHDDGVVTLEEAQAAATPPDAVGAVEMEELTVHLEVQATDFAIEKGVQ
ncbi:hypothetical protein ACPRNU_13950 [Chromobacterium vaccinii]|uniref:hypothetical protein n=1 Tax=Chromobacterium vaccinii TaxID=1108595 RepID=UPI003C727A4E